MGEIFILKNKMGVNGLRLLVLYVFFMPPLLELYISEISNNLTAYGK
jgi:hypothetical protein